MVDLQVYLVHLMVDLNDGLKGAPDGDGGLDGCAFDDVLDGRLVNALDDGLYGAHLMMRLMNDFRVIL